MNVLCESLSYSWKTMNLKFSLVMTSLVVVVLYEFIVLLGSIYRLLSAEVCVHKLYEIKTSGIDQKL